MSTTIHWLIAFYHGYNHYIYTTWNWGSSKHPDHFLSLYFVMLFFATIGAFAIAVAADEAHDAGEEDFPWFGFRIFSLSLAGAVLIPFVVLAAAVVIVLTLPTLFIISWFKAIPSKAKRIEKKQAKVADLRAAQTEVSNGA